MLVKALMMLAPPYSPLWGPGDKITTPPLHLKMFLKGLSIFETYQLLPFINIYKLITPTPNPVLTNAFLHTIFMFFNDA